MAGRGAAGGGDFTFPLIVPWLAAPPIPAVLKGVATDEVATG